MKEPRTIQPRTALLDPPALSQGAFGVLCQAFALDILSRTGYEEGFYQQVALELLEEGQEPVSPVQNFFQLDLKLVLELLRKEGRREKESLSRQIIRLQEGGRLPHPAGTSRPVQGGRPLARYARTGTVRFPAKTAEGPWDASARKAPEEQADTPDKPRLPEALQKLLDSRPALCLALEKASGQEGIQMGTGGSLLRYLQERASGRTTVQRNPDGYHRRFLQERTSGQDGVQLSWGNSSPHYLQEEAGRQRLGRTGSLGLLSGKGDQAYRGFHERTPLWSTGGWSLPRSLFTDRMEWSSDFPLYPGVSPSDRGPSSWGTECFGGLIRSPGIESTGGSFPVQRGLRLNGLTAIQLYIRRFSGSPPACEGEVSEVLAMHDFARTGEHQPAYEAGTLSSLTAPDARSLEKGLLFNEARRPCGPALRSAGGSTDGLRIIGGRLSIPVCFGTSGASDKKIVLSETTAPSSVVTEGQATGTQRPAASHPAGALGDAGASPDSPQLRAAALEERLCWQAWALNKTALAYRAFLEAAAKHTGSSQTSLRSGPVAEIGGSLTEADSGASLEENLPFRRFVEREGTASTPAWKPVVKAAPGKTESPLVPQILTMYLPLQIKRLIGQDIQRVTAESFLSTSVISLLRDNPLQRLRENESFLNNTGIFSFSKKGASSFRQSSAGMLPSDEAFRFAENERKAKTLDKPLDLSLSGKPVAEHFGAASPAERTSLSQLESGRKSGLQRKEKDGHPDPAVWEERTSEAGGQPAAGRTSKVRVKDREPSRERDHKGLHSFALPESALGGQNISDILPGTDVSPVPLELAEGPVAQDTAALAEQGFGRKPSATAGSHGTVPRKTGRPFPEGKPLSMNGRKASGTRVSGFLTSTWTEPVFRQLSSGSGLLRQVSLGRSLTSVHRAGPGRDLPEPAGPKRRRDGPVLAESFFHDGRLLAGRTPAELQFPEGQSEDAGEAVFSGRRSKMETRRRPEPIMTTVKERLRQDLTSVPPDGDAQPEVLQLAESRSADKLWASALTDGQVQPEDRPDEKIWTHAVPNDIARSWRLPVTQTDILTTEQRVLEEQLDSSREKEALILPEEVRQVGEEAPPPVWRLDPKGKALMEMAFPGKGVASGGAEGFLPEELAYGPGSGQPLQPPSGGFMDSAYVRSLPEWARRFLKEGAGPEKLAASPPSMATARQIAALAPPAEEGRQITWSAPGMERPPAEVSFREKASGPPAVPPRLSDGELRRTADRVYRMIEDRLRRERRRLDL